MNGKQLETITRSTCRICDSPNLSFMYSIGNQYVNNFIDKDKLDQCIKAPLEMVFCENCTLLQLKHTAPQELLYARYYWYKSNFETIKISIFPLTPFDNTLRYAYTFHFIFHNNSYKKECFIGSTQTHTN